MTTPQWDHATYSAQISITPDIWESGRTYGIVKRNGKYHARNYHRHLKNGKGLHWLEIAIETCYANLDNEFKPLFPNDDD